MSGRPGSGALHADEAGAGAERRSLDEEPRPTERRVSDRRVLLLMAALVVAVLAANVLSALVPGMDGALAAAPFVVVLLVVVTSFVLVRAVRSR
jgi:hypothetical protein